MLLLNQDAICNMKTNEFTPENESMEKKNTLTKPKHCYYSVKYSFPFRVTISRITFLPQSAIMISPMTSDPPLDLSLVA